MAAVDHIEPAHIKAFLGQMTARYKSVVLDRNTHEAVQKAADFVRILGMADPTPYLKGYAFTLGTFIWFPFDTGNPSTLGDWTLAWQLITIAHEHVHVRQFHENGLKFVADYTQSTEGRAMRWEAEAYCVAAEVWKPMYGTALPDPVWLTAPLQAYGCSAEEVKGAAEVVRTRMVAIDKGAILTPEGKLLLEFMRQAQLC